ncbi:hypothetical protein DFJ73DRAFT_864449, partial [Zopfochytrium polystomum]
MLFCCICSLCPPPLIYFPRAAIHPRARLRNQPRRERRHQADHHGRPHRARSRRGPPHQIATHNNNIPHHRRLVRPAPRRRKRPLLRHGGPRAIPRREPLQRPFSARDGGPVRKQGSAGHAAAVREDEAGRDLGDAGRVGVDDGADIGLLAKDGLCVVKAGLVLGGAGAVRKVVGGVEHVGRACGVGGAVYGASEGGCADADQGRKGAGGGVVEVSCCERGVVGGRVYCVCRSGGISSNEEDEERKNDEH